MRQIRGKFRGKVMYTNQMIKEKLIKLNTDCSMIMGRGHI